jgi:hypothetical protein
MKPKIVKRFEYKGRTIKIQDMGKGFATMRYWYVLKSGFSRKGGNTIDEATKTAKGDLDLVDEMFGDPQEMIGANDK